MRIIMLFTALFLITGCVTATTGNLSPEHDYDDTYGQYPSNYEWIVKDTLKNLNDVSYQIKPPYKGYSTKPADREALEDLWRVLELRSKIASEKRKIGELTGNWQMMKQAEIEQLKVQRDIAMNQSEISRGRVIDRFGYIVEVSVSRGAASLRYCLLIKNGEVIQYWKVTD